MYSVNFNVNGKMALLSTSKMLMYNHVCEEHHGSFFNFLMQKLGRATSQN